MPTKSHIHKKCETLKKNYFPKEGMLKFTYKGNFWTTKKAYKKLLYSKSKCKHMLWCLFYILHFFLKNITISIFGSISKNFPQANCLWTDFGKIW
jgi:hypothetical protein